MTKKGKKSPRKNGNIIKTEDVSIGTKLQHIRLRKDLTLKALAAIVGCSESLLSKIENYRANPSLDMVKKIASALGINVGDLYSNEDDPLRIVSRAGTRPLIQVSQTHGGQGLVLERLIPYSGKHLLQCSIHHIAPGYETDGPRHDHGEKFGFILEGELELRIADQIFIVREDDSFCFQSSLPYSYRNATRNPARMLLLNTPPNF